MTEKVVAIVSGGLDSVTLAYYLKAHGYDLDIVSFDYGQRHKKELYYAAACARVLEVQHDIVDLTGLTHLISNSALTSPGGVIAPHNPDVIEVPEGHYAEENMKMTVVPNRNMIMLSIAAGIAVNRGADMLATAVHSGDHFIYPDCRPRFIAAANAAIVVGNSGFGKIPEQSEGTIPERFIEAPFLHMSKADIAYQALQLQVPFHMTWSCYKGGNNHCGRCGTCVERLEAIEEASIKYVAEYGEHTDNNGDPRTIDYTEYEDKEFWRQAVREAKEKANG